MMHLLLSAAALVAPLEFKDVELSTGVRIRYAEQGDPAGLPVIMLHGLSDSWFSFSRILPLLAKDLHVFALDQRGHGRSGRPATGYTARDLAADVVAFMDAQGIERAVLVGHSMGSFVAQQVAATAPERVLALALIGSARTPAEFTGMAELEAETRALTDPVPEPWIRGFQESTVTVPVPADFMATVVAESRLLDAATWRQLAAGLSGMGPQAYAAHGIPTWLSWGAEDAYAQKPAREALQRHAGRAQRTVYERTGHSPHWERPERFARDLEAFLSRARAATTSRRSA